MGMLRRPRFPRMIFPFRRAGLRGQCIRWLLKMDILVAAVPLAYELASVTRRVPPHILMQPKDICRKKTRTEPASAKNGRAPSPHFHGDGERLSSLSLWRGEGRIPALLHNKFIMRMLCKLPPRSAWGYSIRRRYVVFASAARMNSWVFSESRRFSGRICTSLHGRGRETRRFPALSVCTIR